MANRASTVAKREPAVVIGTVGGAVAAVIALLVAFGVDLTEAQTTAILGVVAAFTPIITSILTRRKVTPTEPVGRPENTLL